MIPMDSSDKELLEEIVKLGYPEAGAIKALRVKQFIECFCTYSTGTKFKGKPFRLIPWQFWDVIVPFFADIDENGLRNYRTCYIEIPKKQGKTELMAALMIYFLCADGELGAAVYVAAADREQAGLTYNAAAIMVRANSMLSRKLKLLDSKKRMIYVAQDGFAQVLSAEVETKHGINPSAVLIDELHAHPNDKLYRYLTSGTDIAREQQAVFVATTAGVYDPNSIWWRQREHAFRVRDNIIQDSTFLPVLYTANLGDDPADEELWKRVNPSEGYIFDISRIRKDFEAIKDRPIEFQDFQRFRLNIPIRQIEKWMPMPSWNACKKLLREETFMKRKCYGGVDLSDVLDLSAFVLIFEPDEDGIVDMVVRFYCPEESVMLRSRRDKVPYDIWVKQGHIIETPGATVDKKFIEADVIHTIRNYKCPEIGYDPWKGTDFRNRIMEEVNPSENERGFQMVLVRQGGQTLHEPCNDMLTYVLDGKLRHSGNPVMDWCMDNLVMKKDANFNMSPDKKRSSERIDGASALVTAWSRLLFHQKKKKPLKASSVIIRK